MFQQCLCLSVYFLFIVKQNKLVITNFFHLIFNTFKQILRKNETSATYVLWPCE